MQCLWPSVVGFPPPNLSSHFFKYWCSRLDLSDYADPYFYNHLCAATTVFLDTQNISDDHPAVEFLHAMENTAYYYVDENWSGYILAQRIIQAILRWANMLNCRLEVGAPCVLWFHFSDTTPQGVAVSVSNVNLMERVCLLTNKIYREMLCIKGQVGRARVGSRQEQHLNDVLVEMDDDDERMTYITMGGLDHVEVSAFSWTPQYRIILSRDLLAWISVKGRIPSSFTNFITTPELSGRLHISTGIYHTQITEYLLEKILLWALFSLSTEHLPKCYSVRRSVCFINPDWTFREHISRSLPTERIFYLLRSIQSECLLREYSAELMLDTLEIIIKWLQVSVSERNRQTPSD